MSEPVPAPNGAGDAKDPSGFLGQIIGAPVTVKLNSGVVYKGKSNIAKEPTSALLTRCAGELQSVDGYMNIALEQTREIVNGKLRRSYGDAFVRGNNGETFSTADDPHHGMPLTSRQSCISQQTHETTDADVTMRKATPALEEWANVCHTG